MNLSVEEIKKYLSADLFKELDLNEIPESLKMEILAKLAENVYLSFVNYLGEIFSEDDFEKLEGILARNASEEFEELVRERVPNYQEVLSEIIAEEKKRLLDLKKLTV